MPAPKGNKNAINNDGGRPPLFDTVKDLQNKIDAYFKRKKERKTICGLAYYLGFESRQSFYDYEKRVEFSYTIKRARLRIEMVYENNLQSGFSTGSIFALKNMSWSDKQEIEHNLNIQSLPDIIIKNK
jgi:hypothetical protein